VVIGDLNEYLQEMESVILSYHGHIDKYMGDGIMAEFGAPISYETHAIQAVLAGIKMQGKLVSRNFPWEMRIGIATGDAITGLIGSKRQNYTAIGDVVNVASRVEAECKPGIVTIDEDTYKFVAEFVTAKRKLYLGKDHLLDEKHRVRIEELEARLQEDPDDFEANKELGLIFKKIRILPLAIEHIKKALDLEPDDHDLKLAFAETTIESEKQGNIPIRGKKKTLHLFEVTGLKDPLKNPDKIPHELFDRYAAVVDNAEEYPSGILLPIEALDGSIGHSKVVGFLSYALADSMGVPEKEKKDILLAGYLCDIGKEIIPHHILNRRGRLSSHEFDEVLKHCEESVRILKKLGYENEYTFEIIAAHHENFNGSGYPKGLRGTDIPLGARIVGIADRYDALTSWRPYREKWDYRAAYAEIEKGKDKGKADPDVVNYLGELIKLRAA
jgi:putative nucleotidyltransferase with HDIG domain